MIFVKTDSNGFSITEKKQNRESAYLLAGISLLFVAITMISVWRPIIDETGLITGITGSIILWGWAILSSMRWKEITIKTNEKIIVFRRYYLGSKWQKKKILPFAQLKTVRVSKTKVLDMESTETHGILQLIQKNGQVCGEMEFESIYQAQEIRKKILEIIK